MRKVNKSKGSKREVLLFSNRGMRGNVNFYKFTLFGLLVLFGLVPQGVFAQDQDVYDESFFSMWNRNMDKLGDKLVFTAYGESKGCAVQPTKQKSFTTSSAISKPLKDFFGSSAYGLVNVYSVVDGKRYYISERDVSKSFYFSLLPRNKPSSWFLEFYECPKESKKTDKTPDGYRHDDLICDHGTSVSRVVCKYEDDCSRYHYEEVMQCKSGTYCKKGGGDCILEDSDGSRETRTGKVTEDTKGNGYETVTDTTDDTKEKYSNIITQLDGKKFDEKVVNDKIDEERKKAQVIADKKATNEAQDIPVSFIVTIGIVFMFFVLIVILILVSGKSGGRRK